MLLCLTVSGNPLWVQEEVTVTSGDRVAFVAVKGGGSGEPFGDISIDYVVITAGDCSNRNAGTRSHLL